MFWIALAGCRPDGAPAIESPTSGTLAALDAAGQLVAVNTDEDTVSWIQTATGEVDELEVGREPTRVTAAAGRIWVTTRLDGEVVELTVDDTGFFHVVQRRWVGSEPYGIVATADGSRVFVAVSMDDRVLELDTETLDPVRSFDVPSEPRWLALRPDGRELAVGSARGSTFHTLAVGLDLAVARPHPLASFQGRATGDMAYSADGWSLAIPFTSSSDPVGPLLAYYSTLNGAGVTGPQVLRATRQRDGGYTTVDRFRAGHHVAQVAWQPGEQLLCGTHVGLPQVSCWTLSGGGSSQSPMALGARGLIFAEMGEPPWVHVTFDRTVERLGQSHRRIVVAKPALDDTLQRGRELFHNAADPQMGAGGVSCDTCHDEGRSDGRTWGLNTGRWQTPSLAGAVASTSPVTWSQDVPSVAAEAELTITGPMGGTGLEQADLEALAAWVNHTRLPTPPTVEEADEVLALGERVFHRAEVGCADCHVWPTYTDNRSYGMFGRAVVQTPSLLGLAATAPYLHDGSAETLEDVLRLAEGGEMGHPEHLSDEERRALIAWLRTL